MNIKLRFLAVCFVGLISGAVTPVLAQNGKAHVACSADGNKIVAVFYAGGISNSIDGGVTWQSNNVPVATWYSVASSADGSILVAGIVNGGIYTSTNGGTTWMTNNVPVSYWGAVACSQDGRKLVAADYIYGAVYSSTNAGSTWRPNNLPNLSWTSVASSADGSKLAITASSTGSTGSGIYTSIDSGATWTSNSYFADTNVIWQAIASSANGSQLVAAALNGNIYTSTNWGTNWAQTSAPIETWEYMASSADGTRLAATSIGAIYLSTDSGRTWTPTIVGGVDWYSVASSADGDVIISADWSALRLRATRFTPTPILNISPSNNNVVLSWVVPSISLVLQQNANLATTNWTGVGTSLTLTNLHYQTIVSPATNKMFYRLKSM